MADNASPWRIVIGRSMIIMRFLSVRKNERIRLFPIIGWRPNATNYNINIYQSSRLVNQEYPYQAYPYHLVLNFLRSFFTKPTQPIHSLLLQFQGIGDGACDFA
jgi:hypothetical protein